MQRKSDERLQVAPRPTSVLSPGDSLQAEADLVGVRSVIWNLQLLQEVAAGHAIGPRDMAGRVLAADWAPYLEPAS